MKRSIRRFGMRLAQHLFSAELSRAVCRFAMVGSILLFNAAAANAAFIAPQVITTGGFTFEATGIPKFKSNPTLVLPIQRTPAVITFLQFDSATNQYSPADIYHVGNQICIQVEDFDQNTSPSSIQTVNITLNDNISGDIVEFRDPNPPAPGALLETGLDTGIFIGCVSSIRSESAIVNDGNISLSPGSLVEAVYIDPLDAVTTVAAAALVDPFGIFFDSATGAAIDNVKVTIMNAITGQEATVFGDDGSSIYPSTIISGQSAIDSSGVLYNFGAGRYRFPLMAAGTYYLKVTPPSGYSFPSNRTDIQLQALTKAKLEAGGRYALVPASRGNNFTIAAGPDIKIDVPLDSKAVDLFVRKSVSTPTVSVGDRAAYTISVENVHPTLPSTTTKVTDILPIGFRYQNGTARLEGAALTDPLISPDGRTLTFSLATVDPYSTKELSYVVVVGSNAKVGVAINTASASGKLGLLDIQSNISNATVSVREDLIRSKGFIVGVVFVDDNLNEIHDENEKGVSGIRIFMEDGRNVVTDKNGRYHFDGVKLGRHIVQMDSATIVQRYDAIGLTQTRFSGSDYSQFVDVNSGGLARTNFRLVEKSPAKMPVTVIHALSEKDGKVWADIDVKRGEDVKLLTLDGFYMIPTGWAYIEGSATVEGKAVEPSITPAGLTWKLDTSKPINHIRLAMNGDGDSGLKEAVTYARFSSPGTEKGRTGLAKLMIKDTLIETRDQRSFTLNVRFKNRKAILKEEELMKLDKVLTALNGLTVREITVEGHTNNIPIAPNHRDEFENNMVLSQARADYIAQYFKEELNLGDEVVHAIGKGATEPIGDNRTAKGRKLNRRVILKVRADKVTHDFSFALQDRLADAYGEALDNWDYEEAVAFEGAGEKVKGILSPAEGMSLQNPTNSVRISLDSRLSIELLVDDEVVSNEKIGFKQEDKETGLTIYTYIGVDFGKTGEHTIHLKGLDPFNNARFEEKYEVSRTGKIAQIKLVETGDNVADGKTPVRFKLEIKDNRGVAINGTIKLKQLGGDLGVAQISEVSVAKPLAQQIYVNGDGWVTLAPVSNSGSHRIVLGSGDVQETLELYIKPEARDWILVGFAEGTVGYNQLSGAVQPVSQNDQSDKFYKDGRVAFYAKGQVAGDFLLTMSYDTQAKTAAEKNSRFGDIDPNSMYTIYGDTTQQQFDGTSSKKLYIKIERDRFYALFGDYNTGLSTTELTRYSRTFTGVKAELHEDKIGFSAFATQTSLTSIKDDIRGNGTSGLYRLSRQNIITNSETIRVETVDRFKSENILESIQLTRHFDYDIDYVTGTVWFKQPILSKDADLNPIMIRVEYESDDKTDQFTVAGGRVYVKPTSNIEIGGTFVSEGHLGGSNTLSGTDVKIQLNDNVEVRAEAATSKNNDITGQAWKVEARLSGEEISGIAYARNQDDNFGLGQQLGSENSTLKVGVDAQYRLNKDARLNAEVFRQEVTNTGATRDLASLQYKQNLKDNLNVRGGVRLNRDVDGAGNKTGSTLASVGATKAITNRLKIRADHEEALSTNNGVDFPSRSSIGADYSVTPETTLSATQEWTRGNKQNTSSTRIGVRTTPWNGAQMSTSYEQQLSEGGKRSFANAGLLQTWKIDDALSFSASMDRTQVLSTSLAPQINLNAATATGGDSFTAYSVGADYKPGSWVLTSRLEWRNSDLSNHRGATAGLQGHIHENLPAQFTLRWQNDLLASNARTLASDASLRFAWRPSYDQLTLLNRFDIRHQVQTGSGSDTNSLRYINNLTANWQSSDSWQLRFNHGIKLTNETLAGSSWSGLTDLIGTALIYDVTDAWDFTVQGSSLHVRHLNNYQSSYGIATGYNMFENFWLSAGYNFVGYYDQDFTAAEYARKGVYMRFSFKYDENSLEKWLK